MKRKMRFVVWVVMVVGLLGGATRAGTTYHVDGDSQTTGDGSIANPFRTIEAGLNKATQGDKVLVHKVDGMVDARPVGKPGWGHYLLTNPIRVERGETLELEAGTVVKFKYYAYKESEINPGIVVDGCLRALGQPGYGDKSVYFTSERDNTVGASTYSGGAPDQGDWDHIVFSDSSDDTCCLIQDAEIRYAGRYQWCCWASRAEAAISMDSASPTIRDTIVRDSYGHALECNLTSSPTLQRIGFINNSINALHVLGGTIHDARTWSNTDVVYYLDNTVTVAAGTGSLTLPAGLVVKFKACDYKECENNPSIVVDGCLEMLGTPGRPVILTSSRDDTATVPDGTDGDTNNDGPSNGKRGDWYHIVFNDSSNDSCCLVEHAEIRYAGRYQWCCWASRTEEGISITGASPTVRYTKFVACYGYPLEIDIASFPKLAALEAEGVDSEDISAVHIIGGVMAGGGTWSNPGIPYYLDQSVTVATGETLAIEPGTVIKFKVQDNIGLYFNQSKLNAMRVSDKPIVFTSIRDDDIAGDTNNDGPSKGQAGDWGQISLANTGRPDIGIINAVFRYAGNGAGNAKIPALLLDFADTEILNCQFETCAEAGVKLTGASIADIRDTLTKRNDKGIHVTGGSGATIGGWTSFQDQTALLVDSADAQVCNSILSYYAFFDHQKGYGVQALNSGSVKICNSDVWSPWGTKYSTPPGDQTNVCNNISANPMLADIYTDNLYLKTTSPCYNKGDDACAVYHTCNTTAAGTKNTLSVGPASATAFLVADWIEYGNDGVQRRVTEVDQIAGMVTFVPPLSGPSQAKAAINDYGSGDIVLHPRICDSQVDMGAYELCSMFEGSECLPKCHPDYNEWLDVGKPNCWCGLYATPPCAWQCQGDADCLRGGSAKTGYYRVGPSDLNILIPCWLVKEPPKGPGIASIPGCICADFAHDAQGSAKTGLMRVSTNDLNILIANWLVKEPPNGPGIPTDCVDCP